MAEWNGETESRLAKSATFPSTSDTSSDTTRWSVSKHSLVGPRPLCRIISTIDHTYWSLCIELNQSHRYWIIINKLVEDNNNTVASTNSLQTNSVSLLLKRQAEPFECHSKVYYTIARRTLIIRVGSEKSATTKAAVDFLSQQQVCLPLLSSPVCHLLQTAARTGASAYRIAWGLSAVLEANERSLLLEYASCFYVSLCTFFLSFCLPYGKGNDKCK